MLTRFHERYEILRRELPPMLGLAAPLVLAELGWMTMGVVDTMMVGRVSTKAAEAIGAVSLGGILFYTVAIFGMGQLLGLDTLVSHAFGAGQVDECHRYLVSALYFILPLAPALMGLLWLSVPLLRSAGIHPDVLREAVPYLRALTWSTFPLLLYFALRRYLQGMNLAKPVMFAVLSANLVNVFGNWVLIYGHLGAPAMRAEGSGWATCLARTYMASVLAAYILYYERRYKTGLAQTPLWPDLARIRRMAALGFPAALQFVFELAVFATATALIARLDPLQLASHQIAMNTVSFTYMVPLGISSAAAVRVGQALGRGDPRGAAHSGWTALALGGGFMFLAGVVLLLTPRYIVRLFTPDAAVVRTGVSLLVVAAFFQLFDGLQTVATGALRGAGDTRTPMLSHLVAYWLIGLPLGYFLCFSWGRGAPGLWAGLCLALILIGSVLLAVWHLRARAFSGAS